MNLKLGLILDRVLNLGVAVVDNTTGQPRWADPSAAYVGKIMKWLDDNKDIASQVSPTLAILERLRKSGVKMPELSSEPDSASN